VAQRLKGMLDGLGLASFAKLSGGKGVHVLVPLNTSGVTFDDTKAFAKVVALTLQRDDAKGVIAPMERADRAGKVFVDWGQNDRNKSTVCAYSVRSGARPTVSMPVGWEVLARGASAAADAGGVVAKSDLLSPVLATRQRLPAV
jgi:bifunctional non-homologous end joining protein LigD